MTETMDVTQFQPIKKIIAANGGKSIFSKISIVLAVQSNFWSESIDSIAGD